MKNKFEIYDWAGTNMFGIESEYNIINHFTAHDWTSQKAKSIIDKVESNRTLEKTKIHTLGEMKM